MKDLNEIKVEKEPEDDLEKEILCLLRQLPLKKRMLVLEVTKALWDTIQN